MVQQLKYWILNAAKMLVVQQQIYLHQQNSCMPSGIKFVTIPYCIITQPAITCSKLTIETLEQGVKYVQS